MESMGLENTRMFPLTELRDITDNFSEARVIGRGGSGVVYKGIFDNGDIIAVKKLDNQYGSSGANLGNGEVLFKNELMNLIGITHKNIIRLVGYCYEVQNMVTEYEGNRVFASAMEERILCLVYFECGNLKEHLSVESCGLEWHVRYGIMKGICEGLKYLHTGLKNPIYHMDLKPENIFLDRNMIPKIGDFGISRLPADSLKTYDTKNISGTLGYMAPEYIRKQISHKSDVYSLGVIMIQVISGEEGYQSYDQHRPSEEFIERVLGNWGKRQEATMSSNSLEQVKICTEISLRCVEFDRQKRPTITDIVNELNKTDAAQCSAVGGQAVAKPHIDLCGQLTTQVFGKFFVC